MALLEAGLLWEVLLERVGTSQAAVLPITITIIKLVA